MKTYDSPDFKSVNNCRETIGNVIFGEGFFILAVSAALSCANFAHGATLVAPNALESVNGGTQSSTGTGAPLNHNAAGTYQMIIDSSHFTTMGANAQITGLAFRLRGAETSDAPNIEISFTDYEIRLGEGALSHGSLSTTFGNNMINPVLVRDGGLTIAVNSFESDGTPSPFAATISFTTPYSYVSGKDLVIEIRHTTGTGSISALAIDANVSLSAYGNSVGDTFVAYGGSAFSSTTGTQTSFTPVQLAYGPVPEPANFAAIAGLGLLTFAACRRSRSNRIRAASLCG